jgi:hypothetical protein
MQSAADGAKISHCITANNKFRVGVAYDTNQKRIEKNKSE